MEKKGITADNMEREGSGEERKEINAAKESTERYKTYEY